MKKVWTNKLLSVHDVLKGGRIYEKQKNIGYDFGHGAGC